MTLDWVEKAERALDSMNKLRSGTIKYVPHFELYECVFADHFDEEPFTEMASVVLLTDVSEDTDENRVLAKKELDKIIDEFAKDFILCLKNSEVHSK